MTSNRVYTLFSLITTLALVTVVVLALPVLAASVIQPRAASPAGSKGLDPMAQIKKDEANFTIGREAGSARLDHLAEIKWQLGPVVSRATGLDNPDQLEQLLDKPNATTARERADAAAAAHWTGLASQYGPVYDADRANSAYGGRWQGLAQSYLAGASSH